ncbi:MAG: AraC family transcriptional regulator [Bulleidia sp.]|nr:AraC family transcriptional regulator [Bulleidia sp.]
MNNAIAQNTNDQCLLGKILYVTHSRYEGDWHSTPHSHTSAELFYVISGKGKFYVEGRYIDIQEDDLIIVNAYTEHTELSKESSPLEYIAAGIEGLHFDSDDQRFNSNFSVHNYKAYKNDILFYLKTLLYEMEHRDNYSQQCVNSLLQIMLINMIRRTDISLNVSPVKKTIKECVFIENYINTHFKEDIDLDKLSEISFLNKYYLVHAFNQYRGISPMRYLVKRRINEAKFLLETTTHNMNEIANIIGFSSQNYFTYAFKREIGCSPRTYRKQFLKIE